MIDFDDFMPDTPSMPSGGELEILRLGETPVLVAVFTSRVGQAVTHYVDVPNLRSELRCNARDGSLCLPCDLRYKTTRRAILPVYAAESDQVKALMVSDSRHPHALGPLLKAELTKGGLDQRYLLISRRATQFDVQSVPASNDRRMGETVIAEFVARLDRQLIDLVQAIPICANEQLWDVPELERKARGLGLERSRYARGNAGFEQTSVAGGASA
jgi:hypothetical protein